ncbi:MAG: hypothetical protein K2M83_08265 [Muribaculaceae bacterium]|nr:hypothetical protein [Muribaculaceae bacterium]
MKKERMAGIVPAWKIGSMALSLLMLLGLGACGEKKTEQTVTPMTTSILGPAGDVFEVVDKPRTLSVKDNYSFNLSVSVKRTAEGSVKDLEWGLELLDENDEVIVSDEDLFSIDGRDTLEGIKVGDVGNLKMPLHHNVDESDVKKITKFRVTSKAKKDWGSSSSATDEVAEEVVAEEVVADDGASASSGSEDWDKVLDEYEEFIDKAVAYAKKVNEGDISAMVEYASMLESAESLQKKLENAGSNLSAAQAARLNKISIKLAQSMR